MELRAPALLRARVQGSTSEPAFGLDNTEADNQPKTCVTSVNYGVRMRTPVTYGDLLVRELASHRLVISLVSFSAL